jgi:hypothetical protein
MPNYLQITIPLSPGSIGCTIGCQDGKYVVELIKSDDCVLQVGDVLVSLDETRFPTNRTTTNIAQCRKITKVFQESSQKASRSLAVLRKVAVPASAEVARLRSNRLCRMKSAKKTPPPVPTVTPSPPYSIKESPPYSASQAQEDNGKTPKSTRDEERTVNYVATSINNKVHNNNQYQHHVKPNGEVGRTFEMSKGKNPPWHIPLAAPTTVARSPITSTNSSWSTNMSANRPAAAAPRSMAAEPYYYYSPHPPPSTPKATQPCTRHAQESEYTERDKLDTRIERGEELGTRIEPGPVLKKRSATTNSTAKVPEIIEIGSDGDTDDDDKLNEPEIIEISSDDDDDDDKHKPDDALDRNATDSTQQKNAKSIKPDTSNPSVKAAPSVPKMVTVVPPPPKKAPPNSNTFLHQEQDEEEDEEEDDNSSEEDEKELKDDEDYDEEEEKDCNDDDDEFGGKFDDEWMAANFTTRGRNGPGSKTKEKEQAAIIETSSDNDGDLEDLPDRVLYEKNAKDYSDPENPKPTIKPSTNNPSAIKAASSVPKLVAVTRAPLSPPKVPPNSNIFHTQEHNDENPFGEEKEEEESPNMESSSIEGRKVDKECTKDRIEKDSAAEPDSTNTDNLSKDSAAIGESGNGNDIDKDDNNTNNDTLYSCTSEGASASTWTKKRKKSEDRPSRLKMEEQYPGSTTSPKRSKSEDPPSSIKTDDKPFASSTSTSSSTSPSIRQALRAMKTVQVYCERRGAAHKEFAAELDRKIRYDWIDEAMLTGSKICFE